MINNDKNAKPNIHIMSDSQNCINILKQKTYTKDEAMIATHQQIDKLQQTIARSDMTSTIIIHWVHSQDKSNCNETVDGHAKISANIIQFLSDDNGLCTCNGVARLLHSTKLINYTTTQQMCMCMESKSMYFV